MREIADVWPIVKAGLEGQQVLCQRIESEATNSGIFDVNCTWAGIEFWLELKAEMRELRPAQKAWAIQKSKAGAKLTILDISREVNTHPGEEMHLYSVHTGIILGRYPMVPDRTLKPPYDWHGIRQYLTMHP
jgi:hypothetical protein